MPYMAVCHCVFEGFQRKNKFFMGREVLHVALYSPQLYPVTCGKFTNKWADNVQLQSGRVINAAMQELIRLGLNHEI